MAPVVQRNGDNPGRTVLMAVNALGADGAIVQLLERSLAQFIPADRADHLRLAAQGGDVAGEIRRRAAEARAVRKDVPEDFTQPDDPW